MNRSCSESQNESLGFTLHVAASDTVSARTSVDTTWVISQLIAHVHMLVPGAEAFVVVPQPGEPLQESDDAGDVPPVVVDLSRRRLMIEHQLIVLTYTEFELLAMLVVREGKITNRDLIAARLQSMTSTELGPRSVDSLVRRLRAKLQPYDGVIRTVRGKGYRFDSHADVEIRFPHRWKHG